jgi:DNA recombination protein RmuC
MPADRLSDDALVQLWWQLDQQAWPLLCAILLLGAAVGWMIASLRKQKEIDRLTTALETEHHQNLERHRVLHQTFTALSAEALQRNNQAFLELAQQVLARFNTEAKGDLELKQQAVRELVEPLRESLRRTEQQLQALERDRRESHGALSRQLEGLAKTQQALRGETRNLVQALRRPEVRGQWGELTLRRLAELAGMIEHCDFSEQVHSAGDVNRSRPDMIVHMPGGRQVVVDVKTPLDAYLSAVEAADERERDRFLARHARHVGERVRELAAKRYWDQFVHAPEFVILFIPGDQFLGAALDQDPALLEQALSQKVILATPTSFVALLRAVAYGWRQDSLDRNAEKIRVLGEDLYRRIITLAEHLGKLGRHLDAGVGQFNRLVGSFESKLVPGARKFVELGIAEEQGVEFPGQVESGVREVSAPDTE